ncbi:MAG TPA: hypothetical protein DC038_12820 [Clostridiales bacterium]|nr:hypothetical protein [Clostridiales bacterium]
MAAVIHQPKVFRNREMLFSINFYYFNLNQHFFEFHKKVAICLGILRKAEVPEAAKVIRLRLTATKKIKY